MVNLKGAVVTLQPVTKRPINFTEHLPKSFLLQVSALLTRIDEGGMGFVHAFRETGIPFSVTSDLTQAMRHSLHFIYPEIDGNTFSKDQAEQLRQFAEGGGTVFALNVFWGNLKRPFGFRNFLPGGYRR